MTWTRRDLLRGITAACTAPATTARLDGEAALDPLTSRIHADLERDAGLGRPVGVQPHAGELSTFSDRGYAKTFAALGVHRSPHPTEDTLACVDARLVVPVLQAHRKMIELLVGQS